MIPSTKRPVIDVDGQSRRVVSRSPIAGSDEPSYPDYLNAVNFQKDQLHPEVNGPMAYVAGAVAGYGLLMAGAQPDVPLMNAIQQMYAASAIKHRAGYGDGATDLFRLLIEGKTVDQVIAVQ